MIDSDQGQDTDNETESMEIEDSADEHSPWRDTVVSVTTPRFDPRAPPGPTTRMGDDAKALDFFNLFITNETMDKILQATDRNANHKRQTDPEKHKVCIRQIIIIIIIIVIIINNNWQQLVHSHDIKVLLQGHDTEIAFKRIIGLDEHIFASIAVRFRSALTN